MKATTLERVFRFNGQELPDPGVGMTAAQVMDFYSGNFPDLVTAEVEGPNELDGKLVWTFKRCTGTKGATVAQAKAAAPFAERLALVAAGQADPLQPRHVVVLTTRQAQLYNAVAHPLRAARHSSPRASLPGLPARALPLLL